jgi:hypothetical protein
MKSLLSIVLLAGLAFAQTTSAPKADQPKAEAESGCCASGASCCGDKDKKDSAKQDGCCASTAGSMCHREPLKDKVSGKSSDKSPTPAPTTKK